MDGAPFILLRLGVAVEIVGPRQRTNGRVSAKRIRENVVRKLCDLSYPKNVKESIPEAIYDLLPKEARTINQAHVHSVNAAKTNNAIDTIREMLKAKTPSDELEQWLKESSGA